jgi:DNA primase
MWARSCNFIEAIRWLCGFCGLDYYAEEEELPDSLQILQMITQMNKECGGEEEEDSTPLKPIDPKILSYYLPVGNILFEQSNISLATQRTFEISYDPQSNHIVIPIRDSLGTLVGIKGRIFQDPVPEGQNKYIYLQPCAKGRVLYGLDKNIDNITQQGVAYVGESEKFVQQIYDMGYYGVATGGSKMSKHQVQMLTRLGVKIVICFDKDIQEDELKKIADQFVEGVPVYAILDRDNILEEKQSPSDDVDKWLHLVQNNIYKIR